MVIINKLKNATIFTLILVLCTGCATQANKTIKEADQFESEVIKISSKDSMQVNQERKKKPAKMHKACSPQKYKAEGLASWYVTHEAKAKKKTVIPIAAHRTLPMRSLVMVTNVENNKSLLVMIGDRGPYYGNRIIDLSEEAAKDLGFVHKGLAKVRVQTLDMPIRASNQIL